jgi:hypothetical protein
VLQRRLQPLAPQEGLPFSTVGQAVPQALQFSGSVRTSTQEPAQFCLPPAHVTLHAPAEHASPGSQARPQAPQLPGSLLVSTHSSPHLAKPLLQVEPHWPSLHTAMPSEGALHTVLHVPQ